MSDVGDLAYGDLVLRLDGSVIELLIIPRDGSNRIHANRAQGLLELFAEAERRRVPVLGAVSY